MVRSYKRKFEKPDENAVANAVTEIKNGERINTMTLKYGIPRGVLRSRLKDSAHTAVVDTQRYKQVFSNEQEAALEKYLVKSAAMYFGLTRSAVQQLAYGFAVKLKSDKKLSKIPKSWHPNVPGQYGSAGADWLYGFMRRHPNISLRKPQATSLDRVTAFNRHNVRMFFEKLKEVIDRFHIEAQNIWNMDETALTTVQKPIAVIAKRGIRNIGRITSAERGVLVTLAQKKKKTIN